MSKTVSHGVFSDARVKIITDDDTVTPEQGKDVADAVEAAWDYAKGMNGYPSGDAMDKVVRVVILSPEAYKAAGGEGAVGFSPNKKVFMVPTDVIGKNDVDILDTYAHELSHVQDGRATGDKTKMAAVPIYLQEGKAYTVGNSYAIKLGFQFKDPELEDVAEKLGSITRADAEFVMKQYRTVEDEDSPENFRNEVTGALFVNWLKSQRGHDHATQDVGAVIKAVGKGESYEDAFTNVFGMSPVAAEDQFIAFIGETEGKPQERLKGTIWAASLRK